jgi:5-methylcytosine-specific restriction protein A
MAINMLKPRLTAINVNRVKVLDTKAGATQRVRGRSWMSLRREVLLRDGYACQSCGIVRVDNECDHRIPLEQGGAAMDIDNMQTLCGGPDGCHTAKSKREAGERAMGGGGSKV